MSILRKISLLTFWVMVVFLGYNAYSACTMTGKTYTSCNSGYLLQSGDCVACTSIQNSVSSTSCTPTCSIANGTCSYSSNCGTQTCTGYYTGGGGSGSCTGCSQYGACQTLGCTMTVTGCDVGYYKCGSGCCVCDPNCTCAGGLADPVCTTTCPSGQYLEGGTCKLCSSASNTSSKQSCTISGSTSITGGTRTCSNAEQTCNGNYTGGPGGTGGSDTCTGCSSWGTCTCKSYSCSCDDGYYSDYGNPCTCIPIPEGCDTNDCTSSNWTSTCTPYGYGSCNISTGCCRASCSDSGKTACTLSSDCSCPSGYTATCTLGCCGTCTQSGGGTTTCEHGSCTTASDCSAVSGQTASCNSIGCCVYTSNCGDSISCALNMECTALGYSACTNGCCTGTGDGGTTSCGSAPVCFDDGLCIRYGYASCDTSTHCCVMGSGSGMCSTTSCTTSADCCSSPTPTTKRSCMCVNGYCYGTTSTKALTLANCQRTTVFDRYCNTSLDSCVANGSGNSNYPYSCAPNPGSAGQFLNWSTCDLATCPYVEGAYTDAAQTTTADGTTVPGDYDYAAPITACYIEDTTTMYDSKGTFSFSEDCYYDDGDNSDGECVQSASCSTHADCGIGGYCNNSQCYCCQSGHTCSTGKLRSYVYCGSGTCTGTLSGTCTCPEGSGSGGGGGSTTCEQTLTCTSDADCGDGTCETTRVKVNDTWITFKRCVCP